MINKNEYISELEKVLQYFYDAKMIGNKEQIKYFQGMSKGIILILKKLEIIDDEALKEMVKNAELEVPLSIERRNKNDPRTTTDNHKRRSRRTPIFFRRKL